MDTEDIKNMTTAYLQVLAEAKKKKDGMHKMPDGSMMKDDDPSMKEKKKLDPVDKNALKGDHDDREDSDIDNDGDTDASDEYLHNRRKTIKKSMKNDSKDESYGNVTPKMAKGVMMGKGSNLPKINKGVKMGKPIAGKSETYEAQPKSQVSLAPNNPLDKMKPKKEMMKLKAMKNLYMNKKESADRKALRNEEVELDEALNPKDKKVIDAFYDGRSMDGKMLSTDGNKLEKTGMGGQTIASKTGSKFKIVAKMDSRSTQDVVKYIEKSFPKNVIEKVKLNELSPRKLGSYINKAAYDAADFQNTSKRRKGIARATNKLVKKAGGKPKRSMFDEAKLDETSKNRWPIYNKIMENRAMQTKGATEPEGMYSKSSEGEKAFIAMHTPNGEVDPRFDANVAAEKTAQSIANSVKPGTGNDAAGNAVPGDKAIRK